MQWNNSNLSDAYRILLFDYIFKEWGFRRYMEFYFCFNEFVDLYVKIDNKLRNLPQQQP